MPEIIITHDCLLTSLYSKIPAPQLVLMFFFSGMKILKYSVMMHSVRCATTSVCTGLQRLKNKIKHVNKLKQNVILLPLPHNLVIDTMVTSLLQAGLQTDTQLLNSLTAEVVNVHNTKHNFRRSFIGQVSTTWPVHTLMLAT